MKGLVLMTDKEYSVEEKLALYSQVAHMYYEQGMQQPEIAEKLYFSRSKVCRILQKAQEMGIVDIKVPFERNELD